MKTVLNYLLIFICTVFILFFSFVLSIKIPHSAIEENMQESVEFYKTRAGIYRRDGNHLSAYIHYFADTRKLNILYCMDSDKPIESILMAKYYQTRKSDTNLDFIDLVEQKKEPNTQYLRYWNGCLLFLNPLLTIFNMQQIYLINQVLLSILALIVFIMLFKRSKKLAFIFLAALILVASWYVTFCIEYSVTFYVMFITSIVALKIECNKNKHSEKKVNEKLVRLFFVCGIVTTFFDFLTTELLTIFVPLLFILIIRKEEGRLASIKSTSMFVLKSFILWFIGYSCMWVTKWVLASVILHVNAFEYVHENFTLRINGLQGLSNHQILYSNVIPKNLFAIPILDYLEIKFYKWEVKALLALFTVTLLALIDWKELKNKKYLIIFILIALTPYLRYFILANHSYRHAMFTFRDQIITLMVLMYIIVDCLNYNLMRKKISVKNIFKNKFHKIKELESGD